MESVHAVREDSRIRWTHGKSAVIDRSGCVLVFLTPAHLLRVNQTPAAHLSSHQYTGKSWPNGQRVRLVIERL